MGASNAPQPYIALPPTTKTAESSQPHLTPYISSPKRLRIGVRSPFQPMSGPSLSWVLDNPISS